ncbi:MAG TPA: pyridoxal phosphate-dependent aminotransferase, partial [Bryobacteraceae bacterium]|nr:pyridoxal phosphate-dependent aminotransferase [Bryobacteraceae bacterium]
LRVGQGGHVTPNLTPEDCKEFLKRGFSRRSFGRIATMLTAGATLPLYNEPAMAQLSVVKGPIPADAILLNANENPMGPCAEAMEAMHNIVPKGGRYMYKLTDDMRDTLAAQEGLNPKYVRPFAGSSAPLQQAVLAFCNRERSYVAGDPGYEQGGKAAEFAKAKVFNVPLTKDYAHDVKAMAKADANAGLLYLCNPNNPTGTLTSREDMEWLLNNKPAGSILMVDEAYIHFASGASTMTDMVAKDKDIIVLRTFSKLYGMAGIRAGVAMARPDLLEKFVPLTAGAMPVTSMVAANASLQVKDLVAKRRKTMQEVREDTLSWLDKHNFHYVPSVSNKFMVDVKRPGREVADAMFKEKIIIGRTWPCWPNYVRVTVGTRDEMEKFKAAFLKVMA